MILVLGATGTTGSALVETLLARGREVTAVTRDPSKVAVRDGLAVSTSIVPAEAIYLVAPPGPEIVEHDRRYLEAARANGIGRVVKLSAIGTPETPVPDNQLGSWHQPGEEAVRRSGLVWTILRPTTFASNSLAWADDLRSGRPVPNFWGDGQQGVIDPADIAAVAAEALTGDDHDGQTYTLTGPELITVPEQVAILGEVIGGGATTKDMDAGEIGVFAEGARFVREGRNAVLTDDVERILGRRPATFRAWAEANRARFQPA
ncbi:NAD(P)H-binding protein [Actinoplanes sp. LDG1-06]|uniref:NAD(P)H-binding protein n=1 Tax=Paractinoplanes ovalisporus TaxID=2810368 RepID=A0ABS2AD02_9ACTN|nr:NAD(P)H-binding protein [Actinoplanes ovalisporus]MBM2617710.1 NAD(P)H-binding protein [Actinoplanes ovalisporus]